MKQVFSYLKQFKKEIVMGPAFKIIETFFELLTPFIMAKLIDEGIPHHDNSLVFKYGLILLLFAIFGFGFTMLCQFLAAKTQEAYGTILRHELFAHIQALDLEQTQTVGANSLITRLTTDIYQIQSALAMFIRLSPRAPFLLLGSAVMTFLISPKLALVFLVVIPLIVFVFFLVMKQTIPMYQKLQQKVDQISLLTNENLTGARVIRAFSKQAEQYEKFEQETTSLKQLSRFTGRIEALLNPTTQLIVNLTIAVMIYFGQFEINIGNFTQGEMIAIINYVTQISLALVVLVNLSIIFSKGYTSVKRVGDVFDLPVRAQALDEVVAPTTAQPAHAAIIFDHVSFTYPDAKLPMLSDISFAVNRGGTLGIIGGTGAGKSTLIRLLGKFYEATAGDILLDHAPINHYPDQQLHKKVQIVFQQATLFSGTIAENLRMGNPAATDEMLWQALTTAQATDFIREKADGLDTYIEQGGKNLSGGQRQRLTIARGLVVQPEIIVFDDTSSALDYVTDSRLRMAMNKLPMTVITVSQRINAIRHCDQIIVLDQGKIAAIGTHDELSKTSTLYQEIAKSQEALEDE